jgi:hypothetical protein
MINKTNFNNLLNSIASFNGGYAVGSGPFPARQACATCLSPSGGMIVSRPSHLLIQFDQVGLRCPNRNFNASKTFSAVPSGQADWVTCIMTTASGNSLPVPALWSIRTNGPAPNQSNAPSSYWVEVLNIGYAY